MNRKLFGVALALVFAAVALAVPAAAQTARVSVPSQKNFEQTVSQLKSSVAQGGMMIMATVDQGNMRPEAEGDVVSSGKPDRGQEDLRTDPRCRTIPPPARLRI